MKTPIPERVERFINSMSGNQLISSIMKDNNLTGYAAMRFYGLWEVRGEDANPDMGGHHHEPLLGYFEGRLIDVINYAVLLDRFYTWGSGGSIKQYVHPDIKKITTDSVNELAEIRDRKAALEQQIKEQKVELARLERELGNV